MGYARLLPTEPLSHHRMPRLAYVDNEVSGSDPELAENLRRSRELGDRYGLSGRSGHANSYAARHLRETGHHLEAGCCKDRARIAVEQAS